MHGCFRNRLNNSNSYAEAAREFLRTKAEQEVAGDEPEDAPCESLTDYATRSAKHNVREATLECDVLLLRERLERGK